jgi:hypothetical protein
VTPCRYQTGSKGIIPRSTSITLDDIPDPIYQRIKLAAKRHHRSMNNEIIACLYPPGDRTATAEALGRKNSEWSAPLLWLSELCKVLTIQIRARRLDLESAQSIQSEAEQVLLGREFTGELRPGIAAGC